MATLNKYIISDYQATTLEEKIKLIDNGIDLRYTGFKSGDNNSFVCYKTDSAINRALFWLSSKEDDFVRQPGHGGILYKLLNIGMTDISVESWESTIKTKFNQEFSSELNLLYIKLTPNIPSKKLKLDMIVQDIIAQQNYQFSTETDLD